MKKIARNLDKPLLIISIILFIIGAIMIFSASNVTSYMKYSASPYHYFFKQAAILAFGIIMCIPLLKINTKNYNIIMTFAAYITMGLLGFVLLYTSVKHGSVRWINLGVFNLQPSEIAKIIALMWMACYFDSHEKELDSYAKILYPLGITGIMGVLILIEPDLDTTIIYCLIVGTVFLLAPIGKEIRNKIILILIGAIGIVLVTMASSGKGILTDEQQDRLINFGNPCSSEKYYTSGNQVCNGYIAINNGGLTGVGLGNSTQKYLYLPEAHTDFIFAITMEEAGLVGAFVIFVLYFLLIGRIIKIAKESYNTRGFLICMGVAAYIVLHILVNLGGMFGMMPTTGVPLPFMSYGGSFCLCLIFSLAVVQRINIENRMHKEKVTNRTKKAK